MRHLLILCSLILSLINPVYASVIYRWVDTGGTVHYGEKPPTGVRAERVDPKVRANTVQPTPAATQSQGVDNPQQQQLNQQAREQAAQSTNELKTYCLNIRQNLAQLANNPRIMEQTESGETRRLTEEQRQARISEIRDSIDQHCVAEGL